MGVALGFGLSALTLGHALGFGLWGARAASRVDIPGFKALGGVRNLGVQGFFWSSCGRGGGVSACFFE